MKYLSLPFDVLLSETYASFSTPASVVFSSKCTEIRGYESPCGVMRGLCRWQARYRGRLRIPMWGYEISILLSCDSV